VLVVANPSDFSGSCMSIHSISPHVLKLFSVQQISFPKYFIIFNCVHSKPHWPKPYCLMGCCTSVAVHQLLYIGCCTSVAVHQLLYINCCTSVFPCHYHISITYHQPYTMLTSESVIKYNTSFPTPIPTALSGLESANVTKML